MLTNKGATADTADQDECDQNADVVRADIGEETSCDEESGAHPHGDGNNGDCKAEHGNVHNRSRCIADGLIWVAKGG